ncbi:MAG: hypothetical protein KDB00_24765, partial [Planctomycetales bacterium]|nr:hypothetical protein [Planctomycetales bacterium]
ICFLVLVRMIVFAVRLRNDPRVEIGLAALAVVAVMAALIPYSMQLHFNDYQPLDYDATWQVTNWAFTMTTALQRRLPPGLIDRVVGAAICLALISFFTAWQTTRPRRIATPKRVEEELARGSSGGH